MTLKIRHLLEAIAIKILYIFFDILPMQVSSSIGGFIGRKIGPLLKVNRVARRNLQNALKLNNPEQQQVIINMWDNLGRVVAEFPHMTKINGDLLDSLVEIEGTKYIENAAKSDKSPIFFSGHLANWELIPKTLCEKGCHKLKIVYRKSNNPYVDELICNVRKNYASSMAKGPVGARKLLKAIKQGDQIAMLVDQKQNDGIEAPFFGKNAMTAPAIANLALKYGCPLIPLQIKRVKGSKFKIKVFPPLQISNTGDSKKDTLKIMSDINSILEGWIRENPGQWFWVHNRWPKG